MFERFSDRARRAVVLAQEEARLCNHNYIGTEHLLLGLIHEGEGVAAQALAGLGVDLDGVRTQVEAIVHYGNQPPSGHIPFTPGAKKALENSLREALQLAHSYIGTEHILLGLVRGSESVATQVLANLGVDTTEVRQAVLRLLAGAPPTPLRETASAPERLTVAPRHVVGQAACAFCDRDVYEAGRVVTNQGGVLLCLECATVAVETMQAAGEPTAPLRPLPLPPREFGDPPDSAALGAILSLFERWSNATFDNDILTHVEGGERLAPIQAELRRKWEAAAPPVVYTVSAVRFLGSGTAAVRFQLSALPGRQFDGRVVLVAGEWKIGRETWCDTARLGGVHIPPDLEWDDERDA